MVNILTAWDAGSSSILGPHVLVVEDTFLSLFEDEPSDKILGISDPPA
jgi:hypothetical protein